MENNDLQRRIDELETVVYNHTHRGYDMTPVLGISSVLRVVELTDGSTVATDASTGDIFTLTTTQNFTMSNPTNPTNGQIIIYKIKQDGGGGNVITWDSNFRGSTDVPLPALTTTGDYVDYIQFIYDSSVTKWNCLAYNLGFAT